MHVLIVGITNTGKTTICFEMSARYRAAGKKVIVLDPDLRKEWNADYITDDPQEFLTVCKNSQSCALFIDESGSMIGKYDTQLEWLATQSRKWGHKSHFIMQRGSQVSPTVRNQCSSAFVFKQSPDDAKVLSNNFVCPQFLEAPSLSKGEYIAKLEVDGIPFKAKTNPQNIKVVEDGRKPEARR